GPYCMYTFARAKSILKKAGYRRMELDKINLDMIEHSYDFELIKLLGEAQEVVEKSAQEYSPNVIADYISLLTVNFSKFYESMKVIGSGGAQDARLRLLDAYVQVTKNMFGLLGIDAVESM
ncbi:MAG: arginine--tRNA ligase, partial [Candidatus Micrarchaeota archaeon]|nr:arginine--tRNA ligase [Candidatus Micrarchaeota archaeon]